MCTPTIGALETIGHLEGFNHCLFLYYLNITRNGIVIPSTHVKTILPAINKPRGLAIDCECPVMTQLRNRPAKLNNTEPARAQSRLLDCDLSIHTHVYTEVST